MKFPRFMLLCMALMSALWIGAAHALPSVDEVQAAAKRGDYPAAETMMREVVAAKPDSARAQYVLAEILAHQRKFNEAAEHTRRARELDPKISFTDPAKFSAFEQLLQREQAPTTRSSGGQGANINAAPPMRSAPVEERSGGVGGVPVWLLVGGAILFIWVAVSFMRRRTAAQMQGQPAMSGGYGAPAAGYAPGYGGVPPTSSGPGMLGVGLGAAGGFAAGMLAEKMMHGGHDERSVPHDNGTAGGLIPGSFDANADNAASELTRRDVDFGSGDGWGGGDAGGGGGDFGDAGGGGSNNW